MKIITNPPYQKNLHLKVVQEAMKHSDDVVCLHPDDHMTQPSTYNRWNKGLNGDLSNIISKMEDYDIIDHRAANDYFGLANGIVLNLGIIKYNNSLKTPKYSVPFKPVILELDKLFSKDNLRKHFVRMEQNEPLGQRIFRYHSAENHMAAILCNDGKAKEGIRFNSIEEKNNFIKSIDTWPYKLVYSFSNGCDPAHLPYLGDYTHPWDDAALYKYFGLTQEEISLIEEEMK